MTREKTPERKDTAPKRPVHAHGRLSISRARRIKPALSADKPPERDPIHLDQCDEGFCCDAHARERSSKEVSSLLKAK
jgi:hypothetical protein